MKKDEAFWKRKEVVIFAAVVITGLLLFVGVILLKGRKSADPYSSVPPEDQAGEVSLQAKVMDQEYARAGAGGDIPVGAALAYREEVPLYPRPTQSIKSTTSLRLEPGQPASYLMESQVTGVRTNRDGSIWIILAWKSGSKWIEMYAPSLYFQVVPGARRISFFKDIKLIWEEPE
jgi:hypothetical protein